MMLLTKVFFVMASNYPWLAYVSECVCVCEGHKQGELTVFISIYVYVNTGPKG